MCVVPPSGLVTALDPVLRACGDCYPPSGANGYDSVVGVVIGPTSIATLDDIYALPDVRPWPNLDFAENHSSLGRDGQRE